MRAGTGNTAASAQARAADAAVDDCRVYAYDPNIIVRYSPNPQRRRDAHGYGWNSCIAGIQMRSQACLYKLHHFRFFRRWEKTRCGHQITDRRATFRPVYVRKLCDPNGSGTWAAVVFSSIFVDGQRIYGEVRSENDKAFKNCN